ncbi:hypothetical protein VIGAN_11202800 [Vigna angularis var. angularis]|uniref:Uncharacterized protein n=1 Tax=Vigna angularis var. angularis TaxID=157739 RepID=A0A0S3TBT5_PHAAN|nr:hypothetical protein VIGAN_11202800 [Vigna angularis var. angularis]
MGNMYTIQDKKKREPEMEIYGGHRPSGWHHGGTYGGGTIVIVSSVTFTHLEDQIWAQTSDPHREAEDQIKRLTKDPQVVLALV